MVAGHVPHGRHLPTTCGRHCSLEHTPRLGFWSLLLVAGHAPHRRHLPSTCGRHCSSEHTPRPGFWSHQVPASWQYKPLCSGTAQAPPISLVCFTLRQHVAQHISASCQHKPQVRPSTCTIFAFRGFEAYARRATDKHTGINPSNDHRRGLRLLREPIGQYTPLLWEPDRPSRGPLGLRAPCSRSSCRGSFLRDPPWEGTGGARGMFGLFRLTNFSSTRVIVWVLVHTSIRLARRTNCCSLSAENSTATNLTQLGPLSDLS